MQQLLRKPSRIRVVDDVHQSLENAILSGMMRPGERLREIQLARELEVSRTTIREALLKLEQRGLAVSVPRRGTFVTRLSAADALEVSYLRSLLEGFAISIGHACIDDSLLAELESLALAFLTCELPRDIPRVIDIDRAFHARLVEAAHMPRLSDLWASLNGRIGALMLGSIETKQLSLEDLVSLHREYLRELHSGDLSRMVAAVGQHYIDSQADLANCASRVAQTLDLIIGGQVGQRVARQAGHQPARPIIAASK